MTDQKHSMEEIVTEMEAGLEATRTELVEAGLRDYESLDPSKTVEDVAYFNYFTHFPCKFPGSSGKTMQNSVYLSEKAERAGKSLEEFQRDISTAISASGVEIVALIDYIDRTHREGLFQPATAEIYRELFVPVYFMLREKGYTHNTLC